MRLNLWMIGNRLSALEPEYHILSKSTPVLNSARQAYATNCAHVYQQGSDVICAAEEDYLLFHNADSKDIFEMVQYTFDFYREWQDRLEDAERNLDYCAAIDESWQVFHNPIVLLDASFKVLFMSEQYGENDVNEDWKFLYRHGHSSVEVIQYLMNKGPEALHNFSGLARLHHFSDAAARRNMFFAAIYSGEENCGWMNMLEFEREINDGDLVCLNYLVRILSRILGRINREQPTSSTQNVFLKLMLQQTVSVPSEIRFWKQCMDWPEDGYYYIAVAAPADEMPPEKLLMVNHLLQTLFQDQMVASWKKKMILMYHTQDPLDGKIPGELQKLAEKCQMKIAFSLPFREIKKLHYYYQQALAALHYGKQLDPGKLLYFFYDYALDYAVESSTLETSAYLVHPDVKQLWNKSVSDGGEQIRTLFAYLNNERSLQNTANALYIHRSTLVYRIHKITDAMIYNLNDAYTCDYIKFSIRILRIYYH